MCRLRAIFILLLTSISISTAVAQKIDDFSKEFENLRNSVNKEFTDFKKSSDEELANFRKQINAEFAEFMGRPWDEFSSSPALPVPLSPEPPELPVAKPLDKPSVARLPFKEARKVTPPAERPRPPIPIPAPLVEPDAPAFSFSFYGTKCTVGLNPKNKPFMSDISEQSAAELWTVFSAQDYERFVFDCMKLRENMHLCDWAYYLLVKTVSEEYYGSEHAGESILLQLYVLTQSGYKVRIASANDKLTLLIPFSNAIYQHSYVTIKGTKYYVMDKSLRGSKFNVFNREYSGERVPSLQIDEIPLLKIAEAPSKTFVSQRYPEAKVMVAANRNLIDFYNSYPISSDWSMYARASMSKQMKNSVLPALRKHIADKSETEAADILLNFVQTAFNYQTDDQQFGYERPLFADETFFYPYCDCEDRSILFAILVRELLGLDVVMLHYPKHIATAVCFRKDFAGDYLTVENRKFTICDPSFIGASIGRAMEKYKQTEASVIFLGM
ncbi:MAG: hypothetical protein LBC98_02145 [Prevotellaceae bacterium]|jgi:hypothetical protein|nr:hypothetical protein [Prevotellaceae bacterium]